MIYFYKVKTIRSSVTNFDLEYLNEKNHENIQNSFKIWLEPFHITSILQKLYTLQIYKAIQKTLSSTFRRGWGLKVVFTKWRV